MTESEFYKRTCGFEETKMKGKLVIIWHRVTTEGNTRKKKIVHK